MIITVKKTEKNRYFEGIGRRKTSVARVRAVPSSKNSFVINNKDLNSYFPTKELQTIVMEPIEKSKIGSFSISAYVKGGGIHSQAEAIRHGISRVMVRFDETSVKSKLKPLGFLKRDSRAKERRKFGLKKARKAPQWSKR